MAQSGALGSLLVELGASTATLQSDMQRGSAIVDRAVADINVSINKIGSSANFSNVSNQIKGLTDDFKGLQKTILGLAGIDIGITGLKDLASIADDYQIASNRIRTTVSDSQELVQVTRQVFEIAQQTGSAFDDSAKTYQRLFQVIEGTGKSQIDSQREALALTKTLTQEIVVSGASAGEASRSVMDLVHGLAGGELQARQFNQIMRQMPDLAKQIADGMGVTLQQLEKMVHAGLPAVDVLKALAAQSDTISQRFNDLPQTFARAWQQLSNAVERYVGEAAQGSVISDLLKGSIVGIANNIDKVAAGVELVGVGLAAWGTSRGLQTIAALSTILGNAVTAQGAFKTAAIAAAEADTAAAAASQKAAAATIAHVDALNDLRVVELAELQTKQQALVAEEANLAVRQRSLPIGADILAEEQRLVGVRTELAATTARLSELEGVMAASQARATLAEQAEIAAANELAAANLRLAAAQAEATSASGLLGRAGSGILAAVGGLSTVLIAAGAGILYLSTRESELAKESDELARITQDVTRAHSDLTPALDKAATAAYQKAQADLTAAQASLAAMEATTRLSVETKGLANFNANNSAYGKARADVEQLTSRINELTGAYIKAKLAAAGKSIYEALFPDISSILFQVDALSDGIDKQTEKFKQQAATYGKGQAAVVAYERDQQILKLTLGLSADEAEKVKQAITEKYAADLKAAQAVDAVTAATKAHNKELTAEQRALRDYEADLGRLTDLEDQLASGLSGPYLQALRDYERGIDLTAKTWADAVAAGTANDELIARLSDDQENLKAKLEQTNAQIKAQHDQFTPLNEELQLQITLLNTLPQNQAAVSAGLAAYNKALRDNVDLYGDAIPANKQIKDVLDAQLPSWIATKQRVDDLTAEVRRQNEVWREWQNIAQNAFDQAFSTINKDILEGGDVMKDLVNVAKQVVEAILLQFEKLAIINPLLNQIFGLSGTSLLPTLGNTAGSALGAVSSGGGLFGGLFGGGALATDPDFMAGGALAGTGAGGFMGGLFSGSSTAFGGLFTSAGALGAFGAAIPWIGAGILAIGVLDKLTGGNILGGSKKPWDTSFGVDINSSGISEDAQQQFKKKGALFSGNHYSWQDVPVDEQTKQAMDAFFTSLQKAATQEAASFGDTTGEVVTGSWKQVLDKNGKVLSQTTTIAGQQFTESMQDFEHRILADTLLANLGSYTSEAQAIASKWQASASDLLAGAEFLSAAAADAEHGMSLIAGGSLTDIDAIVEKLNVSGESLVQTYARLQAETQDVNNTFDEIGIHTGKLGAELVTFDDDVVKAFGGLDSFNSEMSQFFNLLYSDSERAAAKLKYDQGVEQSAFAKIGEDPNESIATFRQHFDAVKDSLSPEDLKNWIDAGVALGIFNQDMAATNKVVQDSASQTAQNAANLKAFMQGFATDTNTQFEDSIISLNTKMMENIDTANSYGASLEDIGTIMNFTAEQGVAAFKAFEAQTQQLADSLYGTTTDKIDAQIAALSGDSLAVLYNRPRIDELNAQKQQILAQQEAAKRLSDASTLLADFGQIGLFTGEGLDDIAKQFGVPLDKFAQDLGLDQAGLKDAFTHQEDLASAALKGNELLQDILDVLQGKPIPVIDKNADTQQAIGGKAAGRGTAAPVTGGSIVATSDGDIGKVVDLLGQVVDELRAIRGQGSGPKFATRTARTGVLSPA